MKAKHIGFLLNVTQKRTKEEDHKKMWKNMESENHLKGNYEDFFQKDADMIDPTDKMMEFQEKWT